MKPTWIVQNNIGIPEDHDALQLAAEESETPFRSVVIRPFSEDMPDECRGPIVIYGTRSMIKVCKKTRLRRGMFLNDHGFSFAALKEVYGEHLFNHDSVATTIAGFATLTQFNSGNIFVRGNGDDKIVTGHVTTFDTFLHHSKKYEPTTKILVSSAKTCSEEYRMFICNSLVIATGERNVYVLPTTTVKHYKYINALHARIAPAITFVNGMSEMYSPTDVFAMDICKTDAGWKIVDLNVFNHSAFYNAWVPGIMDGVNSTFIEN